MSTLTQSQIDSLKNKGLTDEKIQALAQARGLELPKQSTLAKIGSSLIKSEKNFGQSIAGALGNVLPASWTGRQEVERANKANQDIVTSLLTKIKEKKLKGEDTSKLLNALRTMQTDINFFDILNESTGGSLNKTARQVFGEGFGVATDILGAGALAGKARQVAQATTFGKGLIQGAKTGALTGGLVGSAQGVSSALQENKTLSQTVGQGVGGGLLGGATGGLVGGLIGGVSGAIAGRQAKLTKAEQDFALDLVSPKPTAAIKQQALEQGRVSEQGLLKPSKILPSKRDYQLAESVKGVISPKYTPIQNINSIEKTVDEINSGVKAYVSSKKVPFNSRQLKSQLDKGRDELKLVFASDSNASKTYDAVVKEFMNTIKTKDTAGLLDARQAVDKIPAIKKLLDSQGLGENTRKEVVLTVRRMANEYIANLLPKGNNFRETLLRESQMIEAMGNIADKFKATIGQNKLQTLTAKYPALKWFIGGAATALVGGAGVGVGSAIINSTD